MEDIVIPNLSEIRKTCKMNIDLPATLSEIMNLMCSRKGMEKTTKLLDDVLAKLARHASAKLLSTDLFSLVKDFIVTVLHENQGSDTSHSVSDFLCFKKNKCLPTVETINDDLTEELKREKKLLEETVKKHQKLMNTLKIYQRNCWKSQYKLTKYRLMLAAVHSSRTELAHKLTASDLKTTDKSIESLQRTLNVKKERAENAALVFLKVLSQVERMHEEMRLLSYNLTQKLSRELLERIESFQMNIKELADILLSKESRCSIVGKLLNIDARQIVGAIMSREQQIYTCPNVKEIMRISGFNQEIPTGSLSVHRGVDRIYCQR